MPFPSGHSQKLFFLWYPSTSLLSNLWTYFADRQKVTTILEPFIFHMLRCLIVVPIGEKTLRSPKGHNLPWNLFSSRFPDWVYKIFSTIWYASGDITQLASPKVNKGHFKIWPFNFVSQNMPIGQWVDILQDLRRGKSSQVRDYLLSGTWCSTPQDYLYEFK